MVNNGYVTLQSDAATGPTFSVEKGKATSRMLWMLAGNRLIERGPNGRMQLTSAGLALLGGRDGASRVSAGHNGFPSSSKPTRDPVG